MQKKENDSSDEKQINNGIHDGHRERFKQEIESSGIDNLKPHQVLEYLLFYCIPRKDTNELAHELIDKFGSISGVFEASAAELQKVKGISYSTALFLTSVPGIARYYLKDRWKDKPEFSDTIALGSYVCDLLAGEKNEAFYVLSLDSQCRLIKYDLVYRGIINEAPVYPRMIVELALKNNASAVVLAHNHPGGAVTASEADKTMTKKMVEILDALSISVVDHIIVSGFRFSSMKAKGELVDLSAKRISENNYNMNMNGDWEFD